MTDIISTGVPEQRAGWGARTNRVEPGTLWHIPHPWPPHPATDDTTDDSSQQSSVKQGRAEIVVRRIYCSCTTESFHDEVYYLFGGVNGAGAQVSHRGPDGWQAADADNATAWDMNDGGDKQNRYLNATIYDEALLPGQNATFACAFFESDGQDYGSTVSAAGKMAAGVGSTLGQPVVAVAGQVLGWVGMLIPKNQDDTLGNFSLVLRNDNGTVSMTDLAAGPYTQIVAWDRPTNRFTVRFRHDDGDYTVDFQVTGR